MHSRSPSPLDLLVRKLAANSALSHEDRDHVRSLPHRLITLAAHSYTTREGDRPSHCELLVSGFAFRSKLTGTGLRQILSLHLPGDPLDFQNLFLERSDHNVQMLTRAQLALIPMKALKALAMSRSTILAAIMRHTQIDSSIFREWTLNIGRRAARTRIAHFLCEIAYRLKAGGLARNGVFDLPMSQEQIADSTGLTTVHVNRVLMRLHAEGLIHRSRRTVRVPDFDKLSEIGDFNPRYLHQGS